MNIIVCGLIMNDMDTTTFLTVSYSMNIIVCGLIMNDMDTTTLDVSINLYITCYTIVLYNED